jgi:hypothetical protein
MKADLETGRIGVTEGYTYANVDSVDVAVRGMGGHGLNRDGLSPEGLTPPGPGCLCVHCT